MKRKYFFLFSIFYLLLSVFLWGCGEGPGSPGSSGSEDTGINIKSVSITSETPDLDVYSCPDCCAGGTSEPGLTREDATISIESEKLNPDSTVDPYPASVEQCTITYKKAIEDPSSPIIESLNIYPNCPIIEGSNSCNVTLIDIDRKQAYWNAIYYGTNVPGEYPTHYIAQYNCKYVNNFGEEGSFQTEYDIYLADFNMCGGGE
ncbi:MAG: hypothetical protein AB1480_03580 [Nitrospirota bacterium]